MRKVIIGFLIVLACLLAVYAVLRFGFDTDILDQSGWDTGEEQVRYLDYYGRPLTGWQQIGSDVYYFHPEDGSLATFWQELDGKNYYFGADGKRTVGWVDTAEGRFLLDSDGAACYGWLRSEDGARYVDPVMGMLTGWQTLEGNRYYFSAEGLLQTGWQQLDTGLHYFDETGAMVTGWADSDAGRCYLGADGAAVTGWWKIGDSLYCFSDACILLTGWYEDGDGIYFLTENGTPHTGWLDSQDGRRYFSPHGLLQTGWQDIDGKRFYFGQDGILHAGWLELDGERYYLLEDGSMATGEVVIDGVSNFFTSTGKYVVMVNPWHLMPEDYSWTPETVEGYEFDVSGAEALKKMLDDCRAAGYRCTINNTYRSKATQQYMWDVRIQQRMKEGMTYNEAIAFIGQSLAKVGASEHHLGLAVDLDGGDSTYSWLAEHCWDYGFILRYPSGKTSVTGIIYEPWHFRYVGTELAQELKELGLCMEEYMAMLTEKAI